MAEKGNGGVSIDRLAVFAVANLADALNREYSDDLLPQIQGMCRNVSDMIDGEDAQPIKDMLQDAIEMLQTARENFGKFTTMSKQVATAIDSTFTASNGTVKDAEEELKKGKAALAAHAG
jgi:hypothetical protein